MPTICSFAASAVQIPNKSFREVCRQTARLKLALNPAKIGILNSRRQSFELYGVLITPYGLQPAEKNISRFRETISQPTTATANPSLPNLIASRLRCTPMP